MTGAGRRARLVGAVAVLAAALGVPSAATAPTGVLALRASLSMQSALTACVAPPSAAVACYSNAGGGLVAGLGAVSQTYLNVVDTAPSACPAGSFNLLATAAQLRVANKGTLTLELARSSACSDSLGVLSLTRAITITGGTGALAGAAGSGHLRHAATFGANGTTGRDVYTGTLVVPGLEFDTTPPRLRGARDRRVQAPAGARAAPVAYRVVAHDERDGSLPTTCSPRPGSRFTLGTTRVRCTATDSSANTARASFAVTVTPTKPSTTTHRQGGSK